MCMWANFLPKVTATQNTLIRGVANLMFVSQGNISMVLSLRINLVSNAIVVRIRLTCVAVKKKRNVWFQLSKTKKKYFHIEIIWLSTVTIYVM